MKECKTNQLDFHHLFQVSPSVHAADTYDAQPGSRSLGSAGHAPQREDQSDDGATTTTTSPTTAAADQTASYQSTYTHTHTHTHPNALCQGWTINRNRNSEPLTNILFPHRLFRFFNPVNTFPLKMYYHQCSRYIIVIKVKCLINQILGFWFRFFNFDFRLYRPALHCGILYISHNAYISVIRL